MYYNDVVDTAGGIPLTIARISNYIVLEMFSYHIPSDYVMTAQQVLKYPRDRSCRESSD